MAGKKPPTPDVPENEPLKDADGNVIDPQEGGVTPPDPGAPTASAPPASLDPDVVQSAPSPTHPDVLAIEDDSAVTMADVAALNGIGLAPDESEVRLVQPDGDVFISAGLASDLEQQGWAVDPNTGKRIVKE